MPSEAANSKSIMRDPQRRKFLPPFSGSPFGEFPPDYAKPNKKIASIRKMMDQTTAVPSPDQSEPPSKFAHEYLKRGNGTGGLCSSTLKGRIAPKPCVPRAGAFARKSIPPTEFRRFYERGDLPVTIQHRSNGRRLDWKVDIGKLDFHHYLPIFFDGLREVEEPFRFIAFQGAYDLLEQGGGKILPTIPQLIIPIKTALQTRDPEIVCDVLKVLKKLVVSGELVGEALVPYYRQILPVLNLFKGKNKNLGDAIEYDQRRQTNLGDLINQTMQLFEMHGGEDAFINIKYMIPSYESCVMP